MQDWELNVEERNNEQDYRLDVEELDDGNTEPRVALVLRKGDQEVLRVDARLFSTEDMVAASERITDVSKLNSADVDQVLAALIEPIRKRHLRDRDKVPPENDGMQEPGVLPPYTAVLSDPNGQASMRDAVRNRVLTNFVLLLDEDIEVRDDVESGREFAGRLTLFGRTVPFRIKAKAFADNADFKAALFETGGCEVVIHCQMDELRRAVSTLSWQNGRVRRRALTTNFGWTADGTAYLTPSLRVTANGIEGLDDQAELRVDLGGETPACHLDLQKLEGEELLRVKRHVVQDLLALNERTVTHTLLGATAASVLYPFAKGAGRFALWLVGRTGSGKSFAGKLFSNFFGDFPVASAPFTTWSATPNYVQRQGYFFKDALYLVDDYKPEVVQPYQVVRVLQAYADNTARGRLKADATANVLRPIRGLLLCTGEDVPEHNASAIARSVIVQVPQQAKNLEAGRRCLVECANYAGVMADFLRWLLAEGRVKRFEERFFALQERYNGDVAGQQNDLRVASNLAQLGAGFELFAEYLGDVWPGWQEAATTFVEEDLLALRAEMLGEAKEQQASEVFLRTLADLIRHNHVRIEDMTSQQGTDLKPQIGRVAGSRALPRLPVPPSNQDRLEICTSLALAQVNASLRQQGRPELKITHSALLQQLKEDGKLLDQDGVPLGANDDSTRRIRLDGGRQVRAFVIGRRELLGEEQGRAER